MRRLVGSVLVFLLLSVSTWPKQGSSVPKSSSSAPKDPQALSILAQVLAASGGIPAISSMADYTATGTIIYSGGQNGQANVTVRGRGLDKLRIDVGLPRGIRSELTNGVMSIKVEDGTVIPVHAQAPIYPARLLVPTILLASAAGSPIFSISNNGAVTIDGQNLQEIQLVRVMPGTPTFVGNSEIKFFVDPTTSQVAMVQDTLSQLLVRQLRYSDYRQVSGLLVPFSVSQQISGQQIWQIQLSKVTFNTGLQDSDFTF